VIPGLVHADRDFLSLGRWTKQNAANGMNSLFRLQRQTLELDAKEFACGRHYLCKGVKNTAAISIIQVSPRNDEIAHCERRGAGGTK
jgi:hypothetical protein